MNNKQICGFINMHQALVSASILLVEKDRDEDAVHTLMDLHEALGKFSIMLRTHEPVTKAIEPHVDGIEVVEDFNWICSP